MGNIDIARAVPRVTVPHLIPDTGYAVEFRNAQPTQVVVVRDARPYL